MVRQRRAGKGLSHPKGEGGEGKGGEGKGGEGKGGEGKGGEGGGKSRKSAGASAGDGEGGESGGTEPPTQHHTKEPATSTATKHKTKERSAAAAATVAEQNGVQLADAAPAPSQARPVARSATRAVEQ
jgi:hypothetical protein